MQNWLLKLRRQGLSVLLVHHAGTNGRQRDTSRREDALDTVIALRRPEDYSPVQGARFEVHFEKLRNRVDGTGAFLFEARVETIGDAIRWSSCDLKPPMLMQAAELFAEGRTVREAASTLRISKSEAGRLRLRALADGMFAEDDCRPADATVGGHFALSPVPNANGAKGGTSPLEPIPAENVPSGWYA
jgi:putative DNA primase/helicase